MKTNVQKLIMILFIIMGSCTQNENTRITQALPEIKQSLIDQFGNADSLRIVRGVDGLARIWLASDGNFKTFKEFCEKQFVPSGKEYDDLFNIVEQQFEIINGHIREINLQLDYPVVTHQRDLLEIDRLFSNIKPGVDYYGGKLAFAISLNFPYYTPAEKEEFGQGWSRKDWAKVRIGDLFDFRPDPDRKTDSEPEPADLRDYTTLYILSMDHVLSPDMEILFPEGTRLNCHNGLRDEMMSSRRCAPVAERLPHDAMRPAAHQRRLRLGVDHYVLLIANADAFPSQ